MLGCRHERKDFVAEALAMTVKTFARRRLRIHLQGGGRQGGRHPDFGLWPRPLDRSPRET